MKWIRTEPMKTHPPTEEAKKRGAVEAGTIYFRQGLLKGNLGPIIYEATTAGSDDGETKLFIKFKDNEHIHSGEVQTNLRGLIEEAVRAHIEEGGSKNKYDCFQELMPWERVQQDWSKSNICPHCGHVAEPNEGCSCMYDDGSCSVNLDCCGKSFYVLAAWR